MAVDVARAPSHRFASAADPTRWDSYIRAPLGNMSPQPRFTAPPLPLPGPVLDIDAPKMEHVAYAPAHTSQGLVLWDVYSDLGELSPATLSDTSSPGFAPPSAELKSTPLQPTVRLFLFLLYGRMPNVPLLSGRPSSTSYPLHLTPPHQSHHGRPRTICHPGGGRHITLSIRTKTFLVHPISLSHRRARRPLLNPKCSLAARRCPEYQPRHLRAHTRPTLSRCTARSLAAPLPRLTRLPNPPHHASAARMSNARPRYTHPPSTSFRPPLLPPDRLTASTPPPLGQPSRRLLTVPCRCRSRARRHSARRAHRARCAP